jgi:hypothetical protein
VETVGNGVWVRFSSPSGPAMVMTIPSPGRLLNATASSIENA